MAASIASGDPRLRMPVVSLAAAALALAGCQGKVQRPACPPARSAWSTATTRAADARPAEIQPDRRVHGHRRPDRGHDHRGPGREPCPAWRPRGRPAPTA